MERDLLKEKKAIEQFQLRTGRDPNPVDVTDIYKGIYGDQLPFELQGTQAASTSTLKALKGTSTPGAALPALESNLGAAQQRVGALSRPNTALNTLQEAIKMKTGAAQAPVGTSDIFAKAGVTGYGALSQSLAARRDEIGKDINDYKDIVNNMAGVYRDSATSALREMEMAYNLYTNELERIDKLNQITLTHKNAIELEKIREEADRQKTMYEQQLKEGAINLFTGEYDLPSDVDSVANAIKQIESGGNYEARGASGEFGAYQFMPQTWYAWSREYQKATGVIPSATPENQDAVAKFKISQMIAQGLPPQDIAAIWNGGAVRKNEQGQYVNTKGVPNVQRYVEKFTRALAQQRGVGLSPEAQMVAENPELLDQYSTDEADRILNEIARSGDMLAQQKLTSKTGKLSPEAIMVIDNPSLLEEYTPTERGQLLDEIARAGGTAETRAQDSAQRMVDQALETIKLLEENKRGMRAAVGIPSITMFIPGSAGRRFVVHLDTLKARLALPNLEFLEGLGRMNADQFKTLKEASESLDRRGLSNKEFKKELDRTKQALLTMQKEYATRGSESIFKEETTPEQLEADYLNYLRTINQ